LRSGAHIIQRIRQKPRQPDAKAEIGKGAKTRDDLAGIAARLFGGDVLGDPFGARVIDDRLTDLRVIDQPLDHIVPTRQLERFNRAGQPRVQLRDSFLQPSAKEPPDRGQQKMAERGHSREQQDHRKKPDGKFNRLRHRPTLAGPALSGQHKTVNHT